MHLVYLQVLGGDSVIKTQCKSIIKQYLPQILEIIDTLPTVEVPPLQLSITLLCSRNVVESMPFLIAAHRT